MIVTWLCCFIFRFASHPQEKRFKDKRTLFSFVDKELLVHHHSVTFDLQSIAFFLKSSTWLVRTVQGPNSAARQTTPPSTTTTKQTPLCPSIYLSWHRSRKKNSKNNNNNRKGQNTYMNLVSFFLEICSLPRIQESSPTHLQHLSSNLALAYSWMTIALNLSRLAS